MDISKKQIKWSKKLESYFKDIGEKSFGYSYLHKKCEKHFSRKSTLIDLPVIILSTIAGTLSIGNTSLFGEDNEKTAGIYIGSISLVVSVMNTVGTYFSWSKRAENHRICTIEYSKLYRFISIELSLPIDERMTAFEMLKVVRENYERLKEVSPLIPTQIIKTFENKFKDSNASLPEETNGLEIININNLNSNVEKVDMSINTDIHYDIEKGFINKAIDDNNIVINKNILDNIIVEENNKESI